MGGINQFCDAGILKVQCNTVHKAGQNPIMPGPHVGDLFSCLPCSSRIVFVWFSLGQCFNRHDPVVYCFMGYQSDIGIWYIILFAPPLPGLWSFSGPGLLTAVRRSRG